MMRRFAARALIALLTIVVFIAFQSMFWSASIPAWAFVVVFTILALSYFRPEIGLLVVAALAPLGGVWESLLMPRGVRGAEAVVLAFLAGALLRGWTLHRFRSVPSSRLQGWAIVFTCIVAASVVRQLLSPAIEKPALANEFFQAYLMSPAYQWVYFAMLLVEGIALLVYAAHVCRNRPGTAAQLVRMLVISGTAAAAFNAWFFVQELLETGDAGQRFTEFLLTRRWSAHVRDINAAGSFFGMTMIMAVGLALREGRYRAVWAAAALLLGAALWMTTSRTAIAAVLLVAVAYAMKFLNIRSMNTARSAAAAASAVAVCAIFAAPYVMARASTSQAVGIRWMFLETTGRMLRAHPLMGVGVGQYAPASERFAPPELRAIYARENAHNNFAQVAGELGLPGLAAFVMLIVAALHGAWQAPARSSRLTAVVAGVAVFILTWLGGHPLLVPAVAYPFWLALGMVAGSSSDIISRETDA